MEEKEEEEEEEEEEVRSAEGGRGKGSLIAANGNRCPPRPGTRIDNSVVVTNMTLFLLGDA
ncbi:hypothetical protein E2C01_087993 [Portunus trituberculatus]|uniref:Uncharacterized protein n=1 Tax=Portunus trituberculatus TaxID=210409 RepID=A0A5B7J810_PORTR|nr:hypothetical protein [Portunus trituberculatus]